MFSITGKDLFDAIAHDIKAFFSGRSGFEVKVEYVGMNPKCRGVGGNCRICLPIEFRDLHISDAAELDFWLLVLGHEMAHYLNRHNDFNANAEEETFEKRAMEDWADVFGAKVMMTLITYGDRVGQIYTSFPENIDFDGRYAAMSKAFAKLAATFYATASARYSPRMVRIGSGVAGIMSFVDRFAGNLNVLRSVGIMNRIYLSPDLKPLFEAESMEFPESVDAIADVHQRIQGLAPAITEGLAPHLERYIGTAYGVGPEERRRYVEAVRQEALRQGLELPPSTPDPTD